MTEASDASDEAAVQALLQNADQIVNVAGNMYVGSNVDGLAPEQLFESLHQAREALEEQKNHLFVALQDGSWRSYRARSLATDFQLYLDRVQTLKRQILAKGVNFPGDRLDAESLSEAVNRLRQRDAANRRAEQERLEREQAAHRAAAQHVAPVQYSRSQAPTNSSGHANHDPLDDVRAWFSGLRWEWRLVAVMTGISAVLFLLAVVLWTLALVLGWLAAHPWLFMTLVTTLIGAIFLASVR